MAFTEQFVKEERYFLIFTLVEIQVIVQSVGKKQYLNDILLNRNSQN